jgi:hypothetical protein
MINKLWSWRTGSCICSDDDKPDRQAAEMIAASRLRAVAVEADLVASVDGSLGVLVNLWANDERLHPQFAPRSPRRRTN